jgi:hypothetical protein
MIVETRLSKELLSTLVAPELLRFEMNLFNVACHPKVLAERFLTQVTLMTDITGMTLIFVIFQFFRGVKYLDAIPAGEFVLVNSCSVSDAKFVFEKRFFTEFALQQVCVRLFNVTLQLSFLRKTQFTKLALKRRLLCMH